MRKLTEEQKRLITGLWVLVILAAGLAVLGGLFPASGAMDTWYVILPFAATIGAVGFMIYLMVLLTFEGKTYDKLLKRGDINLKLIVGFAFGTLITEMIYLGKNGWGEYPKGAVILMITMGLTGCLGLVMIHLFKKLRRETEKL